MQPTYFWRRQVFVSSDSTKPWLLKTRTNPVGKKGRGVTDDSSFYLLIPDFGHIETTTLVYTAGPPLLTVYTKSLP